MRNFSLIFSVMAITSFLFFVFSVFNNVGRPAFQFSLTLTILFTLLSVLGIVLSTKTDSEIELEKNNLDSRFDDVWRKIHEDYDTFSRDLTDEITHVTNNFDNHMRDVWQAIDNLSTPTSKKK